MRKPILSTLHGWRRGARRPVRGLAPPMLGEQLAPCAGDGTLARPARSRAARLRKRPQHRTNQRASTAARRRAPARAARPTRSSASTNRVGRGDLQSARPDERADEARAAVRVSFARPSSIAARSRACSSSERVARSTPSGVVQQVVKMNRAFLAVLELRHKDRVHRAPDDRRFDHGAGVQADGAPTRGTASRSSRSSSGRPSGTRRAAASTQRCRDRKNRSPRHSRPRRKCGRIEDAAVAQHGVAALAEVPHPAQHERRFGRASFQQARTDIQHDRAIRRAGPRARRTPRASSTAFRSNQSSNTGAPVTMTRAGSMWCRSTASRFLDLVPDERRAAARNSARPCSTGGPSWRPRRRCGCPVPSPPAPDRAAPSSARRAEW